MISSELLRRCPLFGSLSEEQLQSIASIAEEVQWEAGQTIFELGSPAERLTFARVQFAAARV